MEKQDMEQLIELTNRLDAEGHVAEAKQLDEVLVRMAAEGEAKGMSNKAMNALRQLHKACVSFCNKNLDSRGENRRKLNKICDMAEDLRDEIEPLL
jgi:phage gp29-like protein